MKSVNPGRQVTTLGVTLRKARQGRFTVEQLAVRAGVSSGLISQIEKGRGNPSFTTLLKLGNALNLPVSAFFEDQAAPLTDFHMVVRSNERRRVLLDRIGLTYELLTPDFQRSISFFLCEIPPGFDNKRYPYEHAGEETTHILRGPLELFLRDQPYLLYEGDTITYDAGTPHAWKNQGIEPALIIGASTPPSS